MTMSPSLWGVNLLSLEHLKHLKFDVTRVLQGCLLGVSMVFKGCLNGLKCTPWVLQGRSKGV